MLNARIARAWSQSGRMTRSDTVKKVDIIKIIVNTVRRFIIYTVQNFGYIFEFTISVRKAWFSSLAYDPALSVPAQK